MPRVQYCNNLHIIQISQKNNKLDGYYYVKLTAKGQSIVNEV